MTTSSDEIFARLRDILVESFELDAEQVTREAQLREDLDLDSIDAIDFMVTLEEAGGLRVEEEELRGLRRFRDLVELVSGKLGAK